MRHSYLLQTNKGEVNNSVKEKLSEYLHTESYNIVYAAMAYVTISGVRDMLDALQSIPVSSKWVIGLDDAISQPGAIDLAKGFRDSHVRVASFEEYNYRFHPKILYFKHSSDSNQAMMMLGSVNLTRRALCDNVESAVFLFSEASEDIIELDRLWDSAWSTGQDLSTDCLESYKEKYKLSKKYRNKASKERKSKNEESTEDSKDVLDSDLAEIDPSRATTCWIECGNVTALGRELEFKAEQGLYFGLDPHGEDPKELVFEVSDGNKVKLRMKYQDNQMWRLQMNNEVPEVAEGLRPTRSDGSLGRSPYVAVFIRKDQGVYSLRFVNLGSEEYKVLRETTSDLGTLGKTTAREYGWL